MFLYRCFTLKILEDDGEAAEGSVIFLITSGGDLKEDDMNKLRHLLVHKQVQVVPVIYPVTKSSASIDGGIELLSQMTGEIFMSTNIVLVSIFAIIFYRNTFLN